jgi:hypothetical protein
VPNYTQTKLDYLSALTSVESIKSIIEGSRPLGNGYAIEINIVRTSGIPDIKITFKGNTDIRRIPDQTIIKYAKALELIDDWKKDAVSDFPDLTRL